MTRAKEHLYLVQPIKFIPNPAASSRNGHTFTSRSRFLPDDILPLFTQTTTPMAVVAGNTSAPQSTVSIDIGGAAAWHVGLFVRQAIEWGKPDPGV
jgi:DNA helicase-2/ATP-dependent DNA helicase PcrA